MQKCDETICLSADNPSAATDENYVSLPRTGAVKIIFFTDPICSHCWAIEPVWRKLSVLYSTQVQATYVHGGLLPNWSGFQDRGNGISKPADVALHWREVALHYGQPINPNVWLDDPVQSSFPSCYACLAVRLLAPEKESRYLRLVREAVFLRAKNVGKDSVLADCAEDCGIDRQTFLSAFRSPEVKTLFVTERQQMTSLGMRGFPSLLVLGASDAQTLRGSCTYTQLEHAVLRCGAKQISATQADPLWWLHRYQSATTRELTEATGLPAEKLIAELEQHSVARETLADADYWTLRQTP